MRLKLNWDVLGISASVACAIHCALLPLVLTSLPVFGIDIIDNVGFEVMMIIIAAAVGFYSLYHGYKKHHRQLTPLFVFSCGVLLLCAKQVWHAYELWLLPPAVLLVVAAHYHNYKSCKKIADCHVKSS